MVSIIYSVYLMLHLSFWTVRFMAKMCYLEAVKAILTLPFQYLVAQYFCCQLCFMVTQKTIFLEKELEGADYL